MPITIKTGLMKYKSQSTGDYIGINAVSDNETAAQIAAIEQKGAEVLEGLPSDYTELAQDVSELKNDPKIYVVTENESGVLNKTWKEIVDASENHTVCLIAEEENNGNTTSVSVSYFEDAGVSNGLYEVTFSSHAEFYVFTTDSVNGYPSFNENRSSSLIDDTAGTGDTDKTFSADKLTTDLNTLSNALSKSSENTNIAISAHSKGDLFWYNGTLHEALSAIAVGDTITTSGNSPNAKDTTISDALIKDIQAGGESVLANGIANIPYASKLIPGVIKVDPFYGLQMIGSSTVLSLNPADSSNVKSGGAGYGVVVTAHQHESAFYGFAKAAGADMKDISGATVGTYPETQKSAISQMLNGAVQVTGTTPVITAKSGIRYICGECATLDITAPASGDIEVIFDSGSTATVLTVTPPTGVTAIKWANGFDPTELEANTRYDLIITDGEWGLAASWAV